MVCECVSVWAPGACCVRYELWEMSVRFFFFAPEARTHTHTHTFSTLYSSPAKVKAKKIPILQRGPTISQDQCTFVYHFRKKKKTVEVPGTLTMQSVVTNRSTRDRHR